MTSQYKVGDRVVATRDGVEWEGVLVQKLYEAGERAFHPGTIFRIDPGKPGGPGKDHVSDDPRDWSGFILRKSYQPGDLVLVQTYAGVWATTLVEFHAGPPEYVSPWWEVDSHPTFPGHNVVQVSQIIDKYRFKPGDKVRLKSNPTCEFKLTTPMEYSGIDLAWKHTPGIYTDNGWDYEDSLELVPEKSQRVYQVGDRVRVAHEWYPDEPIDTQLIEDWDVTDHDFVIDPGAGEEGRANLIRVSEIIGFTDDLPPLESPKDDVYNPSHYKSHPSGLECYDITRFLDFTTGNAVRYLWRAGLKTLDKTVDLGKSLWYVNKIEVRSEFLSSLDVPHRSRQGLKDVLPKFSASANTAEDSLIITLVTSYLHPTSPLDRVKTKIQELIDAGN